MMGGRVLFSPVPCGMRVLSFLILLCIHIQPLSATALMHADAALKGGSSTVDERLLRLEEVLVTLKKTVQSQKDSMATLEETVQSQKESITTLEETVQSQKEALVSQQDIIVTLTSSVIGLQSTVSNITDKMTKLSRESKIEHHYIVHVQFYTRF